VRADDPPPKSDAEETAGEAKGDADAAAEGRKPGNNGKGWQPLRGRWEVCEFGGDGPVKIGESTISLGRGDPMTGVRWDGDFPRDRFELRLEGRRTEGFDFFCGLTFPVGEGRCSLILGGWGGGVVGLSSIDGADASSNATTQFKNFDNGTWYKIRVRVEPEKITCRIDDHVWVEQEREDREFDIRIEMDPTLPMGIANYRCGSELRNLEWRRLGRGQDDGE